MKPILRKFRARKTEQRRSGVAALEFALVAPLLFLILFMMIEASRYLMSLHAVAGAAREANRIYSVRLDEDAAQAIAIDFMRRSSFDVDSVVVRFEETRAEVPGFDVISCEVQIDYEDISLIGDPFDLGVNSIVGFSAMLIED